MGVRARLGNRRTRQERKAARQREPRMTRDPVSVPAPAPVAWPTPPVPVVTVAATPEDGPAGGAETTAAARRGRGRPAGDP